MQMSNRSQKNSSRRGHRPKDIIGYRQTNLEVYFKTKDQPRSNLNLAEPSNEGKVENWAAPVGRDDPGINH